MAEPSSRPPLEDELVLLGRTLVTDAVPDVTVAVRTALTSGSAPSPAPRGWQARSLRSRIAATVAALAVVLAGALVVSPAARAAAVRLLSFVGIELVDAPPPAPPGPGTLPQERGTTLEQARRQVRFAVLMPASLGPPDSVAVSDGGRVVTLTYRAKGSRGALRIDESADRLQPFFTKYVDSATAEYVQVGDAVGIWINRAHEVAYVDANGMPRPETVRLAARTLLVDREVVTVRLEGAGSVDEAVTIAATLR
jgi:hypothetical protein